MTALQVLIADCTRKLAGTEEPAHDVDPSGRRAPFRLIEGKPEQTCQRVSPGKAGFSELDRTRPEEHRSP